MRHLNWQGYLLPVTSVVVLSKRCIIDPPVLELQLTSTKHSAAANRVWLLRSLWSLGGWNGNFRCRLCLCLTLIRRPPRTVQRECRGKQFEDGERSEALLLHLANEDYEHLFGVNESDGWSDDASSIQVSTEDNDLDEIFKDGL